MTTWTAITNAAVAVGGIPSSSTVTALRDNPSALAESASGAPVMVSGWHPVDKVTIGDGKAGLIYDHAVNGTVANVVTSNFEDGYEYRIIAVELSHNSGSSQTINIELYKETDAAYQSLYQSDNVRSNAVLTSFECNIFVPRLSKNIHMASVFYYNTNPDVDVTTAVVYDTTTQKMLNARISYSAGSIDSGKIYLFRRREYASSP